MRSVVSLACDKSGATAAEYALVLAIVGSSLAIAAIALGGNIGNSMNHSSNNIRTCGGAC